MKPIKQEVPAELLAVASHQVLSDLILELAAERPDVRRKCFDFLKSNDSVSQALANRSEGEIIMALWSELEPDLDELDAYGGGDYATSDHVAGLLYQIYKQLKSKKIESEYRSEILDQVLPFIESGNASLYDICYDVAYAACYNDADLRGLAVDFEVMGVDWQMDHARRIYRRIGDQDKYLELRLRRMEFGVDYYDIAYERSASA
jgi:hypothetical protein